MRRLRGVTVFRLFALPLHIPRPPNLLIPQSAEWFDSRRLHQFNSSTNKPNTVCPKNVATHFFDFIGHQWLTNHSWHIL